MLPAEIDLQRILLERINQLPIGDGMSYKLFKKGKRPPGRKQDDYSQVAKNVYFAIGRIKEAISRGTRGLVTDEDFAWYFRDLPVDLIATFRALPELDRNSFVAWEKALEMFVRVPRIAQLYLPESWKEKANDSGKTYWSFIDDRMAKGLRNICPE